MVVKQKKRKEEEKKKKKKKKKEEFIIVNYNIVNSFYNFKKGDKNHFDLLLFRRKSHSEPLVNQVIAFAAQEEAEVGR